METQEIINIINELPIGEEVKNDLLKKIEGGTPLAEVIAEIESLIKKQEEELDTSNPEASTEYKAILGEYSNEVEKASEDFNNNITKLEDEIATVNSEVSKKLDEVKIEELKS